MLATDKWSPMILDKGLAIGSKGGHGPMKYVIEKYEPDEFIQFTFTGPQGFRGFHTFEITALDDNVSELKHTIEMTTTGLAATLQWLIAIRWLHDAYIEDAFDKVESHFTTERKKRNWSIWVKLLRKAFKPKPN
ncbi:hypothetical protein [Hymenobacter jeongseonensis]|nr:hypothetical protein [Hymenobacter jeongseonensis]